MAGLLAITLPLASAFESVLVAEGNPHQKQQCEQGSPQACTSCPAQALPPHTFLPAPVALGLKRQADTFLRVEPHAHGGVPVQVFHFKQPARLSPLELPFGISLVSSVDERGLMSLAAPPSDAADSWFPDYSWSNILVCSHGADGGGLHVGWRFVLKPGVLVQPTAPTEFVALIVRPDKSSEEEADGRAKLGVGQELAVGIEAPAWMLAMAMATRVRSK
eukprot:CAMPEP_0119070494 /NCGR_PEP_ID=MMETSP1178-20130426/40068_1 /TAXON_ID=33656 /ORGANISM="unid sp, Strain CCMP2000" /LENGTH=218 /DNA_ID=CAMNT_0007052341 /DNA_START=15 /DNA_END=671 /DNA_ORIENTATION=+